jgi:LysM repeat protein
MKRLATHLKLFLILLSFILFSLSQPVWAQGQNLLLNPGFEAPFTSYSDASPARQVAQGWLPWYVGGGQSASENVYPEYYPASNVSDGLGVPHIRSGNDAQQYLSFFASHDAGIYQRVTGITQGAQLRFSAYVYVWSSSFDDANESEADGGIIVQVGIDPTGGTSGESPNIVWSAPTVEYDAYNEYSVTATASGTSATVFVRTTVSTPVKNNNVYVDDASLTSGIGQLPTATLIQPSATNSPVPTILPTATHTSTFTPTTPPTNTLAPAATNTPGDLGIFTSTPQPTTTPTSVPTQTSIPTTEVVVPTNTSIPTATPSFTNTPIPASATPTQEQQPTATFTSEAPVDEEFPGNVVHTVRAGDTVGQLATLYGSTIESIISANGLNESALIRVGQALVVPVRLAAPATSTPTITPTVVAGAPTAVPAQPSTSLYIVQAGDTLNRIAARFNTTVAAIAQLNGIANVNVIRVGQQLVIPTGGGVILPPAPNPPSPPPIQQTTYVVQSGDTLFRIALRFGVPLSQLAQANGIIDTNRVYVGQVLVIP